MSASRIAFSSAAARLGSASRSRSAPSSLSAVPSCPSSLSAVSSCLSAVSSCLSAVPSCPSCRPAVNSCPSAMLPSCLARLLLTRFRIVDRMGRIGRPRPLVDANRPEAARLEYAHQLQPDHLEQREERHDQAAAILDIAEQIVEAARLGFRQARQQLLDPRFDRNLLRWQQHLRTLLQALQYRLEGVHQAEEIDFELRLVVVAGDRGDALVGTLPLRRAHLLAFVQQAGGSLEFLVLEQPAYQRV